MKKIILVVSVIAILLSIAAVSQLGPLADIISTKYQITSTISLEGKETCTTEFYDEVEDVNENCVYYYNYTDCQNISGINTDCSSKQDVRNYQCKTGEKTVEKNRTECKPNDEFIILIDGGKAVAKKQIDFSDFGPCIYKEENNCLIVTCVSLYDGAHQGKFTDCSGGKSCQRFEICDDSIKTLYKNSREDFVEDDPSFFLDKLAVKEVEE
jgi:hypothetical protein